MEILHFKDLGDIHVDRRLAANAVIIVLGEYQICTTTYLRVYPPSYTI